MLWYPTAYVYSWAVLRIWLLYTINEDAALDVVIWTDKDPQMFGSTTV